MYYIPSAENWRKNDNTCGLDVPINLNSQMPGRDASALNNKLKGCLLGENYMSTLNDKVSYFLPSMLLKNKSDLADLVHSSAVNIQEHLHTYLHNKCGNRAVSKLTVALK